MWQIIFGSFLFLLTSVFFLNGYFYDKLIKIEYKRFPLDWVKDGRPIGAFFVPPDASLFWGSFSRNRVIRKWLFNKPDWIRRDEEAEKFYKYYFLTGIVTFAIIGLFISILILVFLLQP